VWSSFQVSQRRAALSAPPLLDGAILDADDIAVVGTGFAAQATAIAFRQWGLPAKVYHPGNDLTVLQDEFDALQAMDPSLLGAFLNGACSKESEVGFLRKNAGKDVNDALWMTATAKQVAQYGLRITDTFWSSLKGAMLGALPEETLTRACKLVRLEEDDQRVTMWFEDSDKPVHTRLLVVADGEQPLVQEHLLKSGQASKRVALVGGAAHNHVVDSGSGHPGRAVARTRSGQGVGCECEGWDRRVAIARGRNQSIRAA
jgi:2-polyprenyl-6-methoxyphenol hydroxylase-like FAD-dependent oxidoreductase